MKEFNKKKERGTSTTATLQSATHIKLCLSYDRTRLTGFYGAMVETLQIAVLRSWWLSAVLF
jgi:hypothetical protein